LVSSFSANLQRRKTLSKSTVTRKEISARFTGPLIKFLAATSITPNMLTVFGFLLTIVAALLVGMGHLLAGGIVVLVSGLFDILDGALARAANKVTKFGGILDSTLDRLSEGALFVALIIFYAGQGILPVIIIGVALVGSFGISYVRARAEGAGLKCEVGILTRTERVIIFALSLLISGLSANIPIIASGIIAFFSLITIWQRLYYSWQQTKN
jgi:CDP-diacylglycerol--glycerol-3-phosphate 3-phosphatidyltransferase